jgi:hypothetical protein
MLKGILNVLVSTLLLITTTGIGISKHYCGKTLVSVSLFNEADSCCGDSDCCHNENQLFKVHDYFSASQIVAPPELAEVDILGHEIFNELLTLTCESQNIILTYNDSPPPPKIQEILSLKQVYLL